MIEEHLCAFLVEANIPKFIAYNEVVAFKLNLQIPQRFLRFGLPYMCKQAFSLFPPFFCRISYFCLTGQLIPKHP